MATVKRGIVLMNLGSPDAPETKDVARYLREFLMDERVIDSPYLLRLLLVKGIIVPFRSPKSAHAYQSIWTKEGSPLIVLSEQLKQSLSQEVTEPVVLAMRYGNPSPRAAFDELQTKYPQLEEVILVPLYPHYAMSSYETAVVYAKEQYAKGNYSFRLTTVKPYYDEPQYIDALAASIQPYLQEDYDQLLFSYHGIPERHVQKTDRTGNHCLKSADCCSVDSAAHKTCYRHQCFTTTELVAQRLGLAPGKYANSFQSRLGRAEWLKPYTALRLEELPKEGVKKLVVVCPAFVSDCLETLEEIAMQGKESFLQAGGESFTVVPCLNIHPLWVKALAGWISGISAGSKELVYEAQL